LAAVWLSVREGPCAGREFQVADDVVIGRGSRADVDLEHASVSARHATVSPEGATAVLTDLGSTNGTYVNGRRVEDPVRLGQGDLVAVGACVLEVRLGPTETMTPPASPTVLHPAPGGADDPPRR
jgi:pSer/pThr/pTyr-binding forkhead associated (FHA) protein